MSSHSRRHSSPEVVEISSDFEIDNNEGDVEVIPIDDSSSTSDPGYEEQDPNEEPISFACGVCFSDIAPPIFYCSKEFKHIHCMKCIVSSTTCSYCSRTTWQRATELERKFNPNAEASCFVCGFQGDAISIVSHAPYCHGTIEICCPLEDPFCCYRRDYEGSNLVEHCMNVHVLKIDKFPSNRDEPAPVMSDVQRMYPLETDRPHYSTFDDLPVDMNLMVWPMMLYNSLEYVVKREIWDADEDSWDQFSESEGEIKSLSTDDSTESQSYNYSTSTSTQSPRNSESSNNQNSLPARGYKQYKVQLISDFPKLAQKIPIENMTPFEKLPRLQCVDLPTNDLNAKDWKFSMECDHVSAPCWWRHNGMLRSIVPALMHKNGINVIRKAIVQSFLCSLQHYERSLELNKYRFAVIWLGGLNKENLYRAEVTIQFGKSTIRAKLRALSPAENMHKIPLGNEQNEFKNVIEFYGREVNPESNINICKIDIHIYKTAEPLPDHKRIVSNAEMLKNLDYLENESEEMDVELIDLGSE